MDIVHGTECVSHSRMSKATLNDVKVYLTHLLTGSRRTEVDAIAAAAGYALVMAGTLGEIQALPPALLGGTPNAEALGAADIRHDGLGNALFYLAKAVLAHPDSTADQKEAARFVLEKVIASRRELSAAYATEAARAAERRPGVEAGRSILERLTIFATNAYAWATSFLDAGGMLATLLAGRADAKVDRSPAAGLRAKAIGQIGTLRQIVADAHANDPTLARQLDARLFGFYDLLADMRERGSTEPTPPPPVDPATPA